MNYYLTAVIIIILLFILMKLVLIITCVIQVYKKHKGAIGIPVEDTDLTSSEAVDYTLFEDVKENLEKEGFIKSGDYIFNSNDNAKIYLRILKNFNEGISIHIMQACKKNSTTKTIGIFTKYENGMSIVTRSLGPSSGFISKDSKIYKYIVMSANELLQKHREHIKDYAQWGKISYDKLYENDKELLFNENEDQLKVQEKNKIIKIFNEKKYYKFTLYGAIRGVLVQFYYNWFKLPLVKKSRTPFKTIEKIKQPKPTVIHYLAIIFFLLITYGFVTLFIYSNPQDRINCYVINFIGAIGLLTLHFIDKTNKKLPNNKA